MNTVKFAIEIRIAAKPESINWFLLVSDECGWLSGVARNYVQGQTRAPDAQGWRRLRLVGWSLGRVSPSQPTRRSGSVVNCPSGLGRSPGHKIAFSAYSRPQNASRRKKNVVVMQSELHVLIQQWFLSLSSPRRRDNGRDCPLAGCNYQARINTMWVHRLQLGLLLPKTSHKW